MSAGNTGDRVTIQLQKGPITAKIEDGLVVAQGVKYAALTRFSPPADLEPWTEPVDCTQLGPSCPQTHIDYPPFGERQNWSTFEDEDCLRVNIVAPDEVLKDQATRLPVLVWIHGGGFATGTGDINVYDTRDLARRGLVMVSIQYRLGIFGFAPIPDVAPSNLGLFDQIAALRWIRENVTAFGGDPEQVTVFGHSAGADSVYSLMVADGTDGLFKQAIMSSGSFCKFDNLPRKILEKVLPEMTAGLDIRTFSTEQVLKIQEAVFEEQKKKSGAPGFSPDYTQPPYPPSKEAKDARLKQTAQRVRVMVGWAKDDVLPFIYDIPYVGGITKLPGVGSPIAVGIGKLVTDGMMLKPLKAFRKQYTALGGKSCAWVVEYHPPKSQWRAAHGIEMPFLFGAYEQSSRMPLLAGISPELYEALSHDMKNFFEAFAKQEAMPTDLITVGEGFRFRRKTAAS